MGYMLVFLCSIAAFTVLAEDTVATSHEPLSVTIFGDSAINKDLNDPFYIAEFGSMAAIWQAILKYSEPRLTATYQQATIPRAIAELTRRNNACKINRIKRPERFQYSLFSRYPFAIFPPVRLITLKTNQYKFTSPFSLNSLKKTSTLKIGIVKAKSYSKAIDLFIKENPQFFFVRSADNSSIKLFDMLALGRVDGILDFSQSIKWRYKYDKEKISFTSIAIKEASNPVLGYIACSKTPQGQAILDAIDASYQHPEVLVTFKAFHDSYFGTAEQDLLKPIIDEIFKTSLGYPALNLH